MSFLKTFLGSRPVRVFSLFLLGAFILSREVPVQDAGLFMPFAAIIERLPGLPGSSGAVPGEAVSNAASDAASTVDASTNRVFLVNPVLGSGATTALDPFHASLAASNARVLYYGDSLLWADTITGRLRSLLTNRFGNGGRGLLPLVLPTPDYQLFGVHHDGDGNWEVNFLQTDQAETSRLGLTLQSYRAGPGGGRAGVRFDAGEEPLVVGLFHDDGARFNLQLTDAAGATTNFRHAGGPGGLFRAAWDRPVVRAVVRADAGTMLYGWLAEGGPGVLLAPVIRKGVFAKDLTHVEQEEFVRQLSNFRPTLLILHVGKNECAWSYYRLEDHRAGVARFLDLARRGAPGSAVMLVGPGGRLNRNDGAMRVYATIDPMRAAQRELALSNRAAFYDTYEALGGARGMLDLVSRRLAMSDYVHLTVRGGDRFAERMAQELLHDHAEWVQRRDGSSAPPAGLLGLFSEHEGETGTVRSPPINFDTVGFIVFLIVVFFAWWLLFRVGWLRIVMLLAASYYFYMSWNPVFITLIVFSTLVDYAAGWLIAHARAHGHRGRARLALVASLITNLGLLFFFKYFNLFADFLAQCGLEGLPAVSLILPVGISFYTFQTMSYTLDIYRGQLEPIRSFPRFALFVSFFPQLVAGPIVRARDFLPQLVHMPRFDERKIMAGVFLILVGLFKKVVISDYIAINYVDRVFDDPRLFSGLETLFAVYGYGLQIYCDFSGYSDIAIGAAAMLGFDLALNFNSPYKARTLTEFWHRWHISLSTWLRDYLYIPLGGNRRGSLRTYANLAVTMLLGGLWHGAAYRFVLWGALHGIGLAAVRFVQRLRGREPRHRRFGWIFSWFLTFNFVSFAWIFFRAPDMAGAGLILERIGELSTHLPNLGGAVALVLGGGYLLHFLPERLFSGTRAAFLALAPSLQSLVLLLFAILFYKTASSAIVPFIYFQF